MSVFSTYLTLGFDHISDLAAYDHILFIVALTALYEFKDIKKIAILVTAFTLGHSITLALATLKVIIIPTDIIEFLIPVTIFLTCIYNVSRKDNEPSVHSVAPSRYTFNYFMACVFGLIHGMGFSNYLSMLLGKEENLLVPLFGFNIGIEVGQMIIVSIILSAMFVAKRILNVQKRSWTLFVSGAAAGISLILMSETKFW